VHLVRVAQNGSVERVETQFAPVEQNVSAGWHGKEYRADARNPLTEVERRGERPGYS